MATEQNQKPELPQQSNQSSSEIISPAEGEVGATAASPQYSLNLKHVPIHDIKIPSWYPNDPIADAETLRASIARNGLLNPITCDPNLYLIAGKNRLAQCIELGMTTIPVRIVEGSIYEQKRLLNIDENICRKQLDGSVLRRLLVTRKELYEKLYPESVQGVIGGQARANQESSPKSFREDAAEKLNLSKRRISQLVQAETQASDSLKDAEAKGVVSSAQLEIIALGLGDKSEQDKFLDKIIGQDMTGTKTRAELEAWKSRERDSIQGAEADARKDDKKSEGDERVLKLFKRVSNLDDVLVGLIRGPNKYILQGSYGIELFDALGSLRKTIDGILDSSDPSEPEKHESSSGHDSSAADISEVQ